MLLLLLLLLLLVPWLRLTQSPEHVTHPDVVWSDDGMAVAGAD